MPAYVIANIEPTDPEAFTQYLAGAPATVAAYGGTYLVRGSAIDVCEGDFAPARLAVIRFDSVARARAWYDSPEYRPLRAIRERCARARILIVDGVPPA
jgi:uncharacterized protein (DUF1330 family)